MPTLDELHLKLLEYKDCKNVFVEDECGYRYKVKSSSIINQKLPHKFNRNPFAYHNLATYLNINYPNIKLVSHEYIDCKTPVQFICKDHPELGIQSDTPVQMLKSRHFCSGCCNKHRGERYQIDTDIVVNRCHDLNLEYNGRFIKNKETWIRMACPEHRHKGEFSASWTHLKEASIGCPYCTGRYKTTKDFSEELSAIMPTVKIIGNYTGSEGHIKCQCKMCGHIWSPLARSLKNKEGCPNCRVSSGERAVQEMLDGHGINYLREYTFDDCIYKNKLKFDFYLPEYNCAIEYDGIQHFQPVDFASRGKNWAMEQFDRNTKRDKAKTDYCIDNDIKLLRIPYDHSETIESIISNFLNSITESSETAGSVWRHTD